MQCYGALRRPLRNIIKSIGYAHRTPDNDAPSADSTNSSLRGHAAIHDRLNHTNAITAAGLQHASTPPGRRRWPHDGGDVAGGHARGTLGYSTTATAAPDTQEDRIAAEDGTSDADTSQHPGLRITRASFEVRPIILGGKRDGDLEFRSEVSPDDTSPGHGPVRRVLSGEDAEAVDVNDEIQPYGAQVDMQRASEASHEAASQQEHDQATASSSSYFDEMVMAVSKSRLRDGTDYTKYRPRFGRRYFDSQQRELRARKEKHERMIQLQAERHASFADDDWPAILKLLETHTPADPELYKQKMDTLTLPEGLVAVFHDDVSVAILELRQRTGSHLQLVDGLSRRVWVDGTKKVAFAILTLSGSANENEAALNILQEYVYVYSESDLNASRDLNDYDLQHRQRSVAQSDKHGSSHGGLGQELSAGHTTQPEGDDELSSSDLEILNEVVGSVTSPVRSVWSVGRWFTDYTRYQLGMPPRIRSKPSMTWYLFDITMPVPALAARKDDEAQAHVERVVEELISLCTDPTAPSWLTEEALNKALYYLLKHNNWRAFRTIRRALEAGGKYQFSASNYNALLDGAASMGDVHNFLILTRLMLKREVPVTAQMWKHFHRLVSVRQIPNAVGPMINAMRTKGLLANTKLAQVVSMDLVLERLHADLQAETPFETLWANCNARVASVCPRGFDWFNVHAANRMIQIMLQWGQLDNAYAVLERIRKRNIPIPTSTLNIFLSSALHNRDPVAAASVLQSFHIGQEGAIIPDRITYAELFNIAWLRRYFNMLRVIWRYACAAGHVNYSMRSRLSRSLCSTTLPGDIYSNDISRGQVWKAYAGKFAVGVSRGLTKGWRLEDAGICGTLPKSEEYLLSLASHTMAGKGSEQEKARHAALLDFMQDDLKEVNNCLPVEPLSKVLAKAYARDIAWREGSHLGLPKALSTQRVPNDMFAGMLRQGIKVHMRAGDFTRRAREWEAPGAIAALLGQRG